MNENTIQITNTPPFSRKMEFLDILLEHIIIFILREAVD